MIQRPTIQRLHVCQLARLIELVISLKCELLQPRGTCIQVAYLWCRHNRTLQLAHMHAHRLPPMPTAQNAQVDLIAAARPKSELRQLRQQLRGTVHVSVPNILLVVARCRMVCCKV